MRIDVIGKAVSIIAGVKYDRRLCAFLLEKSSYYYGIAARVSVPEQIILQAQFLVASLQAATIQFADYV